MLDNECFPPNSKLLFVAVFFKIIYFIVIEKNLQLSMHGYHFLQLDIGIFIHVYRIEYSIKFHRKVTSKDAVALKSHMSHSSDRFKSGK